MDILHPDWFRAIPGVLYLSQGDPGDHATLRQKAEKRWSTLDFQKAQVVLVNGLGSPLPEKRQNLIALASARKVVVAERDVGNRSALTKEFGSLPSPTHFIQVRRTLPRELSIEFL